MTISLSRLRSATRVLLVVAGMILWTAEAKAQSVPASSGLSNTASGTACFSEYYGGETNNCGSWQYWIVPLVAPTSTVATNIAVTASVYTPNLSTSPVQCYAYSMDIGTNSLYQTGTVAATATGRTVLGVGWLYIPNDVPNTYFSQVVCAVWPSASVYGVTWQQP